MDDKNFQGPTFSIQFGVDQNKMKSQCYTQKSQDWNHFFSEVIQSWQIPAELGVKIQITDDEFLVKDNVQKSIGKLNEDRKRDMRLKILFRWGEKCNGKIYLMETNWLQNDFSYSSNK